MPHLQVTDVCTEEEVLKFRRVIANYEARARDFENFTADGNKLVKTIVEPFNRDLRHKNYKKYNKPNSAKKI